MEEILASIRRIIADDDVSRAAAPPPSVEAVHPVAPPAPEPVPVFQAAPVFEPQMPESMPDAAVADILDLTDDMRAADAAPSFRTIEPQPDVVFTEADAAGERDETDHLEAARRELAAGMGESLLSSRTASVVDSAFNSLAQTVLVQNARTLEDLVREMLRPMLKSWLDDNLPGLVERLVRAEIERVSRGRSS